MQELLSQLNSVPGVVGSLVFDADGQLVAQAFPETWEPSRLRGAAAALADRTSALEAALGTLGTIDLRFADARILVKPMAGARLLLLCAPTINSQLVAMSSSGVIRRFQKLADARSVRREPAAGGQLWAAVQRINSLIGRSGKDPFKLRGQIALKAGFSLDLIDPDTPDDPVKLEKLAAAAGTVLGQFI